MRKLRRKVAHERMRKAGIIHVNKRTIGDSYFAKHWKEYV